MSDKQQKLPISNKNFQAAQRFLDIFDYNVTTIQVRQDRKQETTPGVELWTGEEGSSVCAYEGPLTGEELKDVREDITLHQNQGLSLWFMVNEGDGDTKEGYVTPRTQQNVTHLTACFVDTDNGDIRKLDKFCNKHDCPYNLKVETSPGKYHIYFLLEKVEATDDNILKWEAIQRTLMQVDKLYDKSLADTSQLLRIPFFYHNKKIPHLIKLSKADVPKYDLDDLYELTEAHKLVKINGQGERFEYPAEKVDSGNRHYSMMAYLRHLSNNGLTSREGLIDAAIGFARRTFTDFKPFMPGNERYGEVEHNVETILHYDQQEKREQTLAKLTELTEKEKVRKDAFHLDPQFFYDCPNKMIGEMVKHSSSGAIYPCPAYDFAAVLAMIGTLKSHLFVSSRGHPPVNYFLCFGPSGVGKDHSQQMTFNALKSLGEVHGFASRLKTEKGLYRGLAENHSRYFVMMDEIEALLAMLTNDGMRVEAYTKTLKDALLHLYTSHKRTFTSALTGNEREKPYVIENPHLNVIGYGTPSALTHGFSLKSVSDGLLPRFIILSVPDYRESNPNHNPNLRFTNSQLDWIREVVMAGKCKTEETFRQIEELKEEQIEINSKSGPKDKEEKARLKEISQKLSELETGGRVFGKPSIVQFTDSADKRYEKFIKKMDDRYNADRDNPIKAIYTRVAEKVGRLATVIADKKIDTNILDYCIEFMEHQLEGELESCGKDGRNLSGAVNTEEKHYQRMLKFIEKLSSKQGTVLKRDISRSMGLGVTLLDKLLELGLEREEITKISAGSGKRGKKGEEYALKIEI